MYLLTASFVLIQSRPSFLLVMMMLLSQTTKPAKLLTSLFEREDKGFGWDYEWQIMENDYEESVGKGWYFLPSGFHLGQSKFYWTCHIWAGLAARQSEQWHMEQEVWNVIFFICYLISRLHQKPRKTGSHSQRPSKQTSWWVFRVSAQWIPGTHSASVDHFQLLDFRLNTTKSDLK